MRVPTAKQLDTAVRNWLLVVAGYIRITKTIGDHAIPEMTIRVRWRGGGETLPVQYKTFPFGNTVACDIEASAVKLNCHCPHIVRIWRLSTMRSGSISSAR